MKRLVMALLAFVFLMSAALALPACAETVIRDGIEVTLTTDKESYDSMDAVNARLTITNTNRYAVQHVSSEITAPGGYVLSGNAEEEHGTLQAGQQQTQVAALYQADYVPKLPKTGDNSHGMLWGLLFVLSSVVLCAVVIHNPHAKRFFSLFLCLVMISTMVLEAVPVVAESAHKTEIIVVSKAVLVNGKKVLLTGTVAYEADIQTTQEVTGPTISGEKINDTAEYVKVREGDKLSFTGKIKASEGAVISTVQVFVYDAETEVPYSMGEKYYTATGVNAVEFDLSAIPEMTIGETFGTSDYALTEGKRYAVMFYATDSNGNGFADMDAQVAGNQGPVISVRVLLPVDKCDHSAKEYTYERDEYTASRITDSGDGLTHMVEDSYKRYCADCGAYLMNIWGSAASQEHTMADGVCTGCGYSTVPMLFAARNSLEKISFNSHALGVLAGQTYYISWDENGGSDTYIVNVKLLDGEPAYHDEEDGTSIVLNRKISWNYISFTVPETAKNGQYVKVHVYGESNGIQTEAGNQLYLRVGCEHKGTSAKTVEKYYPLEGDETHHQCIEYYTHECLVCGFVLEHTESDPVISEHEFNSIGRCSLCRYEKELDCYHTYSNRTLLRSYYQKKNDSQHYLVDVYRVECRDCGMLIYNRMPEYHLQNHEFNAAGECVQCNWNKDSVCWHDNQECTQLGEVTYSLDYLDEYEPIYHRIKQKCVLSCADCGEVIEEDWSTSDVEPHDFDSNNTCRKCGYVGKKLIEDNTAPIILSFTSNVGTIVKIGEMPTYRAVVYDENLRYVELRTDDGWTLDSVTDPVSSRVDLSAWSFAGEAGTYTFRVIAVDYAGNSTVQELTITIVADGTDIPSTCEHLNTKEVRTSVNYNEIDSNSHMKITQTSVVCNDCQMILSEDVIQEPESHKMQGNTCSLCWYIKSAPEVRRMRITSVDGSFSVGKEVTVYAEVTDNNELDHAELYIDGTLVHTEELFGTEDTVSYTTNSLTVGDHIIRIVAYNTLSVSRDFTFPMPITIIEDHTEGCLHPTYTDVYNPEMIRYTDNNDGKTHIWQSGYDRICNTCHENLGVVYGVENLAEHDYTNGDVCPCGYNRNNCQHVFQDIYLPNGNHKAENGIWESKGESGHWCSSIEYWEKCVNCGLEQKYTKLMPYGEEVQPHMMNVVNKTYYAFDENEHWVIGEDKQCTAKGCDYSNYVEKQIIAREAHKYLGGTCICGAKEKTIQNENSTPVTDSSENRKENSIDSNYVYGYELGYDEDNFLYNERLYLTDEARAVWDELSLNKKQIWFEFNVYIISLERFEFESFGDSSSNKKLTKEDKIAMAKVIISAWHREIARDNPQFRISGSQKQKIGDLANMQNELDKIVKQTDSYEALGNLLDIASLIPGLPQVVGELGDVFGYGLKAKETWTKEDLAELVVEIEKYKMEIVGDSLKKNGLDLGLEEDMQRIIEELIDEAINIQKNNIEIAVNQTKTELNAIIDITLGIATGGIVPAVKAGISASENKNKDEIEELERILKGAVKVYLERTKPQLEEAIQNYTDSPTMENYLNMCNGVNGKLDMWLLQSRELSEIYWSWRRLKEEDEEKYILESYQELKYIEDTFEKLSHVEWGYGLVSY